VVAVDGDLFYRAGRKPPSAPRRPPTVGEELVKILPNKGWFTYFRLHGPKQPYFDKTWVLQDIELVT
jgi:hypothetical protein